MSYVTADKDVLKIVNKAKSGMLTRDQARAEIRMLDRFLEWEVNEAMALIPIKRAA